MFTDKIIKNLKPQEKRYQITDGSGLVLYIHPQGKKVFYAEFRLKGTKISKKLGEYPQLSIKQARDAVLTLKSGKELDEDSITLQEAYENWISLKEKTVSPQRLQNIKAVYNNYLAPQLKHLYVANISPRTVRNAFSSLNTAEKYLTISRAISVLNQILVWCVNLGYLEYNKCHSVAAVFPKPVIGNNPTLPYADLHKFFGSFVNDKKSKHKYNLFILFVISTLLRITEAVSVKVSWLTQDAINIPKEATKMKRDFRVPLTPLVQVIINKRQELKQGELGESIWHIPSHTATLWEYLQSLGYKNVQTIHGFRAMGRTWMADNNIREDVAEACLSHVSKSLIVRTYQRSDLFKDRIKAMKKWNDFVIKEFKKGTNLDIYDWIASL